MKNISFGGLVRLFLIVVLLGVSFVVKSASENPVKDAFYQVARDARELYATDESWIFNLINSERRKKHLSELVWNEDLSKIAQNYSKTMARGNFFSHYDLSGANLGNRVRGAHIRGWRKAGENLFYSEGIKNFQSFAVKNWMKSDGHRQNILDKDWTQTGIGIARDDNNRIFVTQIFIQR